MKNAAAVTEQLALLLQVRAIATNTPLFRSAPDEKTLTAARLIVSRLAQHQRVRALRLLKTTGASVEHIVNMIDLIIDLSTARGMLLNED